MRAMTYGTKHGTNKRKLDGKGVKLKLGKKAKLAEGGATSEHRAKQRIMSRITSIDNMRTNDMKNSKIHWVLSQNTGDSVNKNQKHSSKQKRTGEAARVNQRRNGLTMKEV